MVGHRPHCGINFSGFRFVSDIFQSTVSMNICNVIHCGGNLM